MENESRSVNLSGLNSSVDFNGSNNSSGGQMRRKLRSLKPYAKEFLLASMILTWIETVLIILLNVAVIVIIRRYKKRSRLYFLLLNLAIADLITGLIDALSNSIERSMGLQYHGMQWFSGEFGDVTCKLQRYLANVSMTASNYILAVTSIDRALVVAKPLLNFSRGRCLQKFMIIVCGIFSCLVNLPMFYIIANIPRRKFSTCSWSIPRPEIQTYLVLFFVVVFVIPLLIILISYTVLIVAIYSRAMTPQNSCSSNDSSISISQVFNRGVPRSKARSIKLSIGIVLSFLISWSAFFVVLFLQGFGGLSSVWIMPFVSFYYWNCIANPICFFIFHKRPTPYSASGSCRSNDTMNKVTHASFNKANGKTINSHHEKLIMLTSCGRKSPTFSRNSDTIEQNLML